MKVVHIIHILDLGGAESVLENICAELIKNGHEVTVICQTTADDKRLALMKSKGITDIRILDLPIHFNMSTLKTIKKILEEINPDIVHVHLNLLKYVLFSSFNAKKYNVVHTIHSIADKECPSFMNRVVNFCGFHFFGVVPVALSKRIQDSIVDFYHLKPKKIPIILNGADLSKCEDKTDYKLGEKNKLIHIGRFSEEKNHIEMLKAFKKISEKYPNTFLQLVGDGENREKIESFIVQNSLQDSVELLGLTENVFQYLNKADIFLLPSLYEGLPITLIEAMGCGLPCVASKVGGIPDIIEDSQNGIFCEPFCDSIASKLIEFIENEQLRKTCGTNAKETAKDFSAERMGTGYEKLYKQILDR